MVRVIAISLLVYISCKPTDFLTYSRLQSGRADFYFSMDQYHIEGLAGYATVWDECKKDYRILPFTHRVIADYDSTYYKYNDWIYVGRGSSFKPISTDRSQVRLQKQR